MRFLSLGVLFGISWPHRYPTEAEAMKQIADRTLGQLDPIALLDHVREVDPPPSHHAMFGQVRPVANQLRHLSFLFRRQPWFGSGRGSIMQPFQTFSIVAMHPVAQALSIHAAGGRRLLARFAVQHQRQGQHPPRRRNVLATLGRRAQLLRCEIHPSG